MNIVIGYFVDDDCGCTELLSFYQTNVFVRTMHSFRLLQKSTKWIRFGIRFGINSVKLGYVCRFVTGFDILIMARTTSITSPTFKFLVLNGPASLPWSKITIKIRFSFYNFEFFFGNELRPNHICCEPKSPRHHIYRMCTQLCSSHSKCRNVSLTHPYWQNFNKWSPKNFQFDFHLKVRSQFKAKGNWIRLIYV